MGLAEKLRDDELATRRTITIRRTVWAIIGLALLLFVFFYFLLPMWKN